MRIERERTIVRMRSTRLFSWGLKEFLIILAISEKGNLNRCPRKRSILRYLAIRIIAMVKRVSEITKGSRRIPHGVKFRQSPISETTAIESPNESAIRSIRSISSSLEKRAAIRQYPGRKRITGRVSTTRTDDSFSTGR